MPRVLMIIAGASDPKGESSATTAGGYWASEVADACRRFSEAGWQISICSVERQGGAPDPISLDPRFHYSHADREFAAATARAFGKNPEDVELTIDQMSDVMPARRIYRRLVEKGVAPDNALQVVELTAQAAWRSRVTLAEVLKADNAASDTLDRAEVDEIAAEVRRDAQDHASRVAEEIRCNSLIAAATSLSDVSNDVLARIDAVVVCGGRGAMNLLRSNAEVGRIITQAHRLRKVLCFLSHGAAALLSTGEGMHGAWLFDGIKATAASDDESSQLHRLAPADTEWKLESDLKNRGAVFLESQPWSAHVVVDRNVITGQNYLSTGAALASVLQEVRRAA